MNSVTRGVRNAFRNGIRSFSIIVILGLSIGLALTMLVAYQAVGNKITSVKSSVGNTVSISPAGVRGFEGGGEALTTADIAKVSTLANVSSVSQSLSDRLDTDSTNLESAVEAGSLGQRFSQRNGTGFTQNQMTPPASMGGTSQSSQPTRTFTPTITVVGTTDPTDLSGTQGGGTFSLKSGAVFADNSSENVALVGSTLATKNNLSVGSTFTAYGTTIKVVGIFDAGNSFANNQVIMPLKTVQTLSDQADALTSATVTVNSIDNVASVAKDITSTLGTTADVTDNSTTATNSVAPLENIRSISFYSLIGAVIAGSVIVLLTMVMIVRERRREIGVIKAIGASNVKVVGQFMTEALTLTVLASVIGVVIGLFAANPITNMLVANANSSSTTSQMGGGPGGMMAGGPARGLRGLGQSITSVQTNVGWGLILEGLAAAIIIALIGSAIAAFFIAKVRPSEVLRSE